MLRAILALRLRILAAMVSGVLYFLAFPGFDQWYLGWFFLVPVLWAIDDPALSKKAVFGLGWAFGLTAHLGGYPWIMGMLQDFGYLPLPLAFLGYFLLCLAQSTLFAGFALLTHQLAHRFKLPFVYAAPVALVIVELLWPALFPTFISNTQYNALVPLQSVDVWGPLGLSFVLALSSSALYLNLAWLVRREHAWPYMPSLVAALLIGGTLVYGTTSIADLDDTVAHADKQVRVGVVQTNMGIYEKDKDPAEGLRRHREQSLEVIRQGAELVVWPESGYNYAIREGTTNVAERVLGPIDKPLLFGGLRVTGKRGDERRRIYNSSFLTDGAGNVLGIQDKMYLLAFGEYLPLGEMFPVLYDWSPHSSRFTPGGENKPLTLDGVSYGVLICYEDILPGFVREVMANRPDVLVNLTNDAWFGKTREPTIHLALAILRAVEHRRFLVRSTNTGISAIIDPVGRITQQTPVFARANLVGDITPLHVRTLYGILGDWMGYLCVATALVYARAPILALLLRKRRTTSKKAPVRA